MNSLDKINEYVSQICQQIRWKKAHPRISEEMADHIIDGRDSYMAQGLDEDTATEKAIADTGDTTIIGTQLDRIHRPKPQWTMLAAVVAFLMLGIFIDALIFNGLDGARVLWAIVGIGVMLIAYFADFTLIGKYPKTIFFGIVFISIMLIMFSPMISGMFFYGQKATLLFPLAFAAIIFATKNKGYRGILLCGLSFVLLCIIALMIPYMTGFAHFTIIGMALLTLAIFKDWFGSIKKVYGFLLVYVPFLSMVTWTLTYLHAYQWARLKIVLNPYNDPQGAGWWGVKIRESLSSAELFGRSDVANIYHIHLTTAIDSRGEFFLTLLISHFGWASFAVIISALLFFIIKGFMGCIRQKSNLGLFVSLTIMMTFTAQVVSYIVWNLGFVLITPISLPLMSHGNMVTLINLGLIGFMLSVFRTGDVVRDQKISPVAQQSKKQSGFFSWDDGKLTINFKKLSW